MAIPQSFIQELLARADVVDIVGRYVQLKKGGANFMGLCPFHGEKSPSFSVSPSKQFYHCFGCGKNGNAISFLMDHAGMTFIEAVKDLAQQYGLQVPEDDVSPQDRARAAQVREQQATLTSVLEKAGLAYIRQLRTSEHAIQYFKRRGVSGEIAKTFGLGYAPEGWRSLASVFPDYNDSLLVESGLVITGEPGEENAAGEAKRYDRFRDRIMFPIRNVKGECIGFGGRVLGDDKPKYLNSPETPVFSKGRELYGLFEARTALRQHGYALVTEGYMDVVALAQLGFPNAVATLGTACTSEHVQKLFRFTDSVVFSFDGDSAGRRAAHKALDAALPFASDVRTVKFLFLPAEHDPDSFIREHGQEGFAAYVSKAVPLSRFLLEAAGEGCDLDTAEGRAHMASNARPLWTALPEGMLKPQLLAEIADQVMIDSRELLHLWQTASGGRKAHYKKTGGLPASSPGFPAKAVPDLDHGMPAFGDYLPMDRHDDADYAASEPYFSQPSSYAPSPAAPSGKPGKFGRKPFTPGTAPRRVTGRILPASREDRVLRLLLTEPQSWDRLSTEEHQLLLGLPAPHGALFAWLESQLHEHGPQSWAALREGLRGHAHEHHAVAQFAEVLEGVDYDWGETRRILAQLQQIRHDSEIADLAARAPNDPAVLERLRELLAQSRTQSTPSKPA
ncbi:DNA primase [Polaromonas sp. CG_9.11]|uniref:DNA primase n=1 Tax=Polaromonas sp. CG_9.11 TaxID=2787730 RepID=UPI0018C958B6|nr:DNA primase [Polaromonas sp. CG_9.11]MBG6075114.1 DNA primase [Polaromonas sp. CG_9.11]